MLPILSRRGVSTGDCQEARAARLGQDAPNRSPSGIARLRSDGQAGYERGRKRDLAARRYVDVGADGVYLQARLEPQAEGRRVIIGATPEGKKERLGFHLGTRERAQSGRERLVGLTARGGLAIAPELAGGRRWRARLGLWKALAAVVPTTRHRRCWVHKAATMLTKLPKSPQANARQDRREIGPAPDRLTAEAAGDRHLRRQARAEVRAGGRPSPA